MKAVTQFSVKHMICHHCVRSVKSDLESWGFEVAAISFGSISLKGQISEEEWVLIKQTLTNNCLELIEGQQKRLLESIKALIKQHINGLQFAHSSIQKAFTQSTGMNDSQINDLFFSTEGVTIEKYIFLQKIEKAREFLRKRDKSFQQIANELGFESANQLAEQFKKATGISLTGFRKLVETSPKCFDIHPQPQFQSV